MDKEAKETNILYGGPHEGGKKAAQEQFRVWKKAKLDEEAIKREAAINALREVKEQIRREAVRPGVQGIDPYVKLPVVEAIIKAAMDKYLDGKKDG